MATAGMCHRARMAACCLVAAGAAALAGPPGDYGDAPVDNIGAGVDAYPGVVARWVSWFMHKNTVFAPQHPHGSWLNTGATFRLGTVGPTTTLDTTQTPGAPDNDCAPLFLVHAIGPNPLCDVDIVITTDAAHNPNRPIYVNLFVDQNRDGQWKDGFLLATPLAAWNLEHCIQDAPLRLAAGMTHTINFQSIRLENPTATVWVRIMLSDQPIGAAFGPPAGAGFWDATMTAAHAFRGEIEDFRLDYMPVPPGPVRTPGIWYRWIYNNWPPPPPPPPPKPACDVAYRGPWLVATPFCPAGNVLVPLRYRSTSRANGCTINPFAMFGYYGHEHLAGVMVPPVVTLNNPIVFGGGLGAPNLTCADGTVITVPATSGGCPGGCPQIFSGRLPVVNLTGPPGIILSACYPAPRRFRVYRGFLETATCGSPHTTATVRPSPKSVVSSPATVRDVGRRIDHIDWWAGGLLESFIDLEFDRPWPDPDLPGIIDPLTPSGGGGLVDDVFISPPAALGLREAVYRMRVHLPDGFEAEIVEMQLQGLHRRVQLVSADGETVEADVPPSSDWQAFAMPIPSGFALQEVLIETGQGAIDDVFVGLREIPLPPDCPECPADFDESGGVDGDDIGSFFDAWQRGGRCADVDGSGGVDGDDIGYFFRFWQRGGCEG